MREDEDDWPWYKSLFLGGPIDLNADYHRVTNVCDTAAIYRIKKSYERSGVKVMVDGVEHPRFVRKSFCRATSENWVEPTEEFLNKCYLEIKKKEKSKSMEDDYGATGVDLMAGLLF